MSQLFISSGQSTGASASASVLPMNSQGWFPLGLTGLISLLTKGLSGVFSSTTVWRHQFFSAQPFYCPVLTLVHDYWKNHSFDYMNLCQKVMSLLFNIILFPFRLLQNIEQSSLCYMVDLCWLPSLNITVYTCQFQMPISIPIHLDG